MIGPSYVDIAKRYAGVEDAVAILVRRVQDGSTGEWGFAQMIPHPDLDDKDLSNMLRYILSLQPTLSEKKINTKTKKVALGEFKAGFGAPVEGVHPAYDLINIRPDDFKPGVGGMAFMSDGSLIVSTWDSIGAIYRINGLEKDNADSVQINMIASGLAEPLGLTTVNDAIYVLQKHELTKLIDHNQDGITDEYVCVNNQFGVTTDFHEFSYGLVYLNGRFYGGLGLAMRLMSSERQLEDRGTVFSVSNSRDFEIIARGFRQTNGIGVGPDGSIFVTENQGQWVPGCKLIQVKPGAFYGCQFGTGDRFEDQEITPPTVWLPQDEIGNSPGEPIVIKDGPYAGQMMHGDVTHGGIKRVYLEKRNDEYQGCVFRFCQGLEAGINRLAYGPDGALYAGGVGMNGGWSHKEHRFGLQKMKYNNHVPFEMLSISSLPDGFEIQFTTPLDKKIRFDQSKIKIQQWYYQATSAYGGPKLGQEDLAIKSVIMSDDRTLVKLKIDGLKEGHVVYFLLSEELRNEKGEGLWSGEAWYTLNNF
jgi:cytochrome c